MYFLDYLKDSSRLKAKNFMYRILMAGKYHNVGYFKYGLWGPFHNAYHARPFPRLFLHENVAVHKFRGPWVWY